MIPSLTGILLRARQGRYLVMADVGKAFLQMSLKRKNRDVTRFLWLKDKSEEVTKENLATYRFARVPFGTVLNEECSKLSAEVAKNLYVDNVVSTAESELGSDRKVEEAKDFFKKRPGWNLEIVGRLRKAIPQIGDFPYFINKRKLTKLIVKHYHEKLFHASVHYTWSKMRKRYWIPHGRLHYVGGTPFEQPDLPPYPAARVLGSRPFETVALDLFGPVVIKRDHANVKRWVAVYMHSHSSCASRRLSTAGNETEWGFVTPGAPWRGDVYETAIINERPFVGLEEVGLELRPGDFLNPGSARENLTEGLVAGTRRYAGKKIYKIYGYRQET
uniref:Integrase_H2C2 domain-containing protein n=1 Tax=Loa loa TaxID=7209 RepID=A0A1I7VCK4_LOALO